jgi:hypothetical protein
MLVTRKSRHTFDIAHALWIHHDEYSFHRGAELEPRFEETYRFAMITPPELQLMLEDVGFETIRAHSGWDDRSASGCHGSKIIISAAKPR